MTTRHPALRLALQAFVAAALAELLGNLLDPGRSYWAVYTAVSVLIGTWGETARRAVQRTAATVLGIAFGTALFHVTAEMPALRIAAFAVAFFLAGHAGGGAYLRLIFWISVLLALLISAAVPAPDPVLVERIAQIVVGAASGVLVSTLVLPSGIAAGLRRDVAALLDDVARGIADGLAGRFAADAPDGPQMVAAAGALQGRVAPLQLEGALIGRSRAAIARRAMALELIAATVAELREQAHGLADRPQFAAVAAERAALASVLAANARTLAANYRENRRLPLADAGPAIEALQAALDPAALADPARRAEYLAMKSLLFVVRRLDRLMHDLAGSLAEVIGPEHSRGWVTGR